ncbi:MAG: lipoprotein signal peptidase [Flavobacteriales bacterium]|nr:lipoprotein signal peptidase [Flavobacteriales bacterium]
MADQALKVWVKTHMYYGTDFPVFGDWFYIHFVENRGMAFGLELGGDWGKIALSTFRVIAAIAGFWYISKLVKQGAHKGFIVCIALILAGAIGNILDSAFYGLLFSESNRFEIAEFLPQAGGYAPFLYGNVVDMLYFPVIDTVLPEWVPFQGGQRFVFFQPVFNIADSAITIGVIIILIFQKSFFRRI